MTVDQEYVEALRQQQDAEGWQQRALCTDGEPHAGPVVEEFIPSSLYDPGQPEVRRCYECGEEYVSRQY